MAGQDPVTTTPLLTDLKEGDDPLSEVPTHDENKETEPAAENNTQTKDSTPHPPPRSRETKSDKTEDMELMEDTDTIQPVKVREAFTEQAEIPVMDSQDLGKNSMVHRDTDKSHGDNAGEKPRSRHPPVKLDHSEEKKAPEVDQADGPELLHEEPTGTNNADTVAEKGDEGKIENISDLERTEGVKENASPTQVASPRRDPTEREQHVESLGPAAEEKTVEPPVPEVTVDLGGNAKYWIQACIAGLVLAFLASYLFISQSPPEQKDVRQVDIFLRQLELVKTQFPSQRSELWRRSRIHLERHLQTAQPTEPVSLILTAGHRAERTLHCLAQGLASAFSSALNASVLHIDGASKANEDSDQVKLDIDSQLRGAFEGDKPVAVIHRFDELPPGSTLIFYRYCDHENAAYKKTSLIFTVLLEGEEELPFQLGLSAVEEMVDDHLQKKFLFSDHPIAFNRMDLDKYGGLWSRISHLILPVAAEERMEIQGC
ncbi:torsin-1A-interacting protein 1-like isoform 2-T2 [Polymixia lowei]